MLSKTFVTTAFFLFLLANPVELARAETVELKTAKASGKRRLDLNPLHLLCYPCKGVVWLLGGILGSLLGPNLIKQLGIFTCAYTSSIIIKWPYVPNLLCTAIFDTVFLLTKKSKNGFCSTIFLCRKVKNEPATSADLIARHEDEMIEILESDKPPTLSPYMEHFTQTLMNLIPMAVRDGEIFGVTPEEVQQAIRNFAAAVEHQMKYLESKNIEI
ncbi:unnamed protein product [Caenorhabditis bovis]|uniref:Uncharacterized protein n=1 Tax=Caenorhabditis bovis TaxID=2654633 RepID=A0A8S1F2V4_9PELO|nr:unnamed protein product [Caenorhabditis bovis]